MRNPCWDKSLDTSIWWLQRVLRLLVVIEIVRSGQFFLGKWCENPTEKCAAWNLFEASLLSLTHLEVDSHDWRSRHNSRNTYTCTQIDKVEDEPSLTEHLFFMKSCLLFFFPQSSWPQDSIARQWHPCVRVHAWYVSACLCVNVLLGHHWGFSFHSKGRMNEYM